MLGLLINEDEQKEMTYVLQRELDELLFDLNDERIDRTIKEAMEKRYRVLFQLFKRVAPEQECLRYIPK
ncbi:hypothetical protein JNUCC1_01958 [Lentibacillus sp. JNUCC-1]|uniref:hypothetical protein n=1 Tax=Lentibacillus sp. JNUCC-1 TaxID=2654513 RepID=UPI0012E7B4DC|nr:hypothetical protein [Lentibacillus sp. JNUCC-1]MUV38134.1 hypothetical protein [Lentibacillus sp. JNUCC-1]